MQTTLAFEGPKQPNLPFPLPEELILHVFSFLSAKELLLLSLLSKETYRVANDLGLWVRLFDQYLGYHLDPQVRAEITKDRTLIKCLPKKIPEKTLEAKDKFSRFDGTTPLPQHADDWFIFTLGGYFFANEKDMDDVSLFIEFVENNSRYFLKVYFESNVNQTWLLKAKYLNSNAVSSELFQQNLQSNLEEYHKLYYSKVFGIDNESPAAFLNRLYLTLIKREEINLPKNSLYHALEAFARNLKEPFKSETVESLLNPQRPYGINP